MQSSFTYFFISVFIIFVGNLLGRLLPLLRRVALPGAVLGGLLALGLGPQVIAPQGWWVIEADRVSAYYEAIKQYPALFINLVFACLMLGRRFDSLGSVWARSQRMVVMGHLFAWGQYAVGLALVLLLLEPVFGTNPLAGVLIAIGFQGGHGTAAGLGNNFQQLDFAQGEPFALSIATIGVLVGVLGGPWLAHLLKRRYGQDDGDQQKETHDHDSPQARQQIKPNPLTGRLTVHLGMIGIVIGLAWLILRGLQRFETWARPEADMVISNYLPLFSIVLLTGMGLQVLLQWLAWDTLFDRVIFERIGALSLDLVIFSALATLALDVVTQNWAPLLILGAGGIAWNLFILLWVGPRIYRRPWYAFGMGDFGGGTATTATGIMLINVADAEEKTDALKAYTDKQPFYEPFMGGGLVTALALPIVATLGGWGALALFGSVLLGWCIPCWYLAKQD